MKQVRSYNYKLVALSDYYRTTLARYKHNIQVDRNIDIMFMTGNDLLKSCVCPWSLCKSFIASPVGTRASLSYSHLYGN